MQNKYFTKKVVALGLSTLCIGNSLSDLFKARAVLTREALLSVQEAMEKCQIETDTQYEFLQTESEKRKDKVKTAESEIQHINGNNIDWDYLRYLDLAKGAVLERTGVLHDIRFFNGFIKKITVNNDIRQFKNDIGVGLAEVMTALFPSPTGELAVGNNIDMSPELMAKVFGLLYMLRERHIALPAKIGEKIKYLMTLAKKHNRTKENVLLQVKNLNDAKDVLEKKLAELNELEKEIPVELTEGTEPKNAKELKKAQRAKEKAKQKRESRLANIPEIQTALSDIDAYIKIEDLLNTKTGTKNVVRPEKRNTFLKLLYDLSVTINDQEGTEETASDDRPLKQYTAESILLGYFVKKFDTKEEVSEFYRALPEQIKLSENKTSELTREDILLEVKKLHDMLEKAMPKSNIPYDSAPLSNGRAIQTIVRDDGKCYFDTAKRFADCVDTSVRHLVNLMTYNANKEEFHLPGSKCNVTDKDFEKLLAEYNQENNEENHINHKSVKERLHMYYLYQSRQLSNNGDELTRSLWNHVISNISSKDKGMYDVVYMKGKNELSSGLVNVLKMYYNLVYALRDGQGCEEAKSAIDKIVSIINSSDKIKEIDVVNALSDTFKKTLELFNDKYKLDIYIKKAEVQKKFSYGDLSSKPWMDVFGAVCVTVRENNNDLFNFEIEQQIGHGSIKCNTQSKITLDDEEKHLLENEYTALLYNFSNKDTESHDIPDIIYHRSANEFTAKIQSLIKCNEIMRWIAEGNTYMLSEELPEINSDELLCAGVLVNYQDKNIPFIEWMMQAIFNNQNCSNIHRFALWYTLNIFSQGIRHEGFEKQHHQLIEKYKNLLEILKKKKLDVSDINVLKSFDFCKISMNSPYGYILDHIIQSDNEFIEKFIEALPQITGYRLPAILTNKLAQINRWDMVEKLLETNCDFTEAGDLVLTLAKQEKFDLIFKFRTKFDFNRSTFDGTFEPTYKRLEELIKDPKLKKKLIGNIDNLISKIEPITLDDLKDLTKDEFFRDDKLTQKCTRELSDEDFAKLINKYHLSEAEIKNLVNDTLKVKQWNKAKKLLSDMSDTLGIEEKYIFDSGNKELIRVWAEKIRNHDIMVRGEYLMSHYVQSVLHDEETAIFINPELNVYHKIITEKSLESIPVYDDVNKYFEIHEGTSIVALAVDNLTDDDFKRFLKERLPAEKITGKNLFNKIICPDRSSNLVTYALNARFSFSKFISILDHAPKGEIDENTFGPLQTRAKELQGILCFRHTVDHFDEAMKRLHEMGLLS